MSKIELTNNESIARGRAFEVAEGEEGSEALCNGQRGVVQAVAEELLHIGRTGKEGNIAVAIDGGHEIGALVVK